MQEIWVLSLGQVDPLEKGTATYSSILAWKILWTEEPDRLQSKESESLTQLSNYRLSLVALVAQMVKDLPAVQETWV